ncbi:uncharacterized protein ccdc15 isoform 2-T3 [Odontesthes bonariensis]|uniref:uncharacterized protein ccdc15 isoform X2 n=1 Tax=Odontesthes bonariensis TaxID=219752 RepID=UPI003F58A929
MSAGRVRASANPRNKPSVSQSTKHQASRASKVLAERTQAVVAVGAWVEDGQDFLDHPFTLALQTEELQAEKRRENEESLRRFQEEVRHRVAQRAQVCKKRPQPHTRPGVTPDRRSPHFQSSDGTRQVRLRLAACRLMQQEESTSDLPGGRWKISPTTRHKAETHVLRGEEEEENGDVPLLSSQHECPLVQQKVRGHSLWDPDGSHPDPDSASSLRDRQVLWPLTDPDKLQRQSQFLLHRRLVMNLEREQVKENKQHRKHLKRTARIKAEKEQLRMEEEQRLERAQRLAEARQKLEERELLILERLRLEEEERDVQLQRTKREGRGREAARFVDALRAQMKERLCQAKLEPPTLCCCASSFWDSHPDTCANNCVFHNNPKAYAQALHSTMVSLDL